MHSMDNYYATKLMALMREAQVHAVANPLINIPLQGRHDTYPKRRGMTRVQALLLQGINVTLGHHYLTDPWYPMGRHDITDVSTLGAHVAHMTRPDKHKPTSHP